MEKSSLPILNESAGTKVVSVQEMVRRALHAEAIYDATLGELFHLDIGTAIIAPDLAEVDMANELRDVVLPAGGPGALEAALAEAEAAFAARGSRPRAWSFAEGAAIPEVAAALERRGYVRHTAEVWSLRQPQPLATRSDLSVIPARASFGGIRTLLQAVGVAIPGEPPARVDQYAEAGVRVLDDPRVDGLVALLAGQVVGVAYLVTAGESGYLADLYTHPEHRRRKIAATLMERIIELAARSRHRNVLLFCRKDNHPARELYKKAGWEIVAEAHSMRLNNFPTIN